MKKVFGVFVLGLIVVSMCMSFVSAGAIANMRGTVSELYADAVEPLLKWAVGDTEGSPELFLSKVLIGIIIFCIVWVAVSKMPFFNDKGWSLWVVTIAVSLLSIRWIGDLQVLRTIILPYSVLGVALTSGLPFIIYFFVVKDWHRIPKRVAWIFFSVIFFSLWFIRSGQAVDVGPTTYSSVGGPIGAFAWIYLATAGAALLVILLDRKITKFLKRIELEEEASHRNTIAAGKVQDRINMLTARWEADKNAYVSEVDQRRIKHTPGYWADMKLLREEKAALLAA